MHVVNAFSVLGRLMLLGAVALGGIGAVASGGVRMTLWIVALTLGVTGLVFALVGSRLGYVSTLSAGLRSSGVAGTAVVTSVRPLGVRVNGAPVREFGLEVDVVTHAPYTAVIRQLVPLWMGESVGVGRRLVVVVDPTDRSRLGIDWDATSELPGRVEAPVEEAPVGRSEIVDAERLVDTGRTAKAVIISMSEFGGMAELGLVEVASPGDGDELFIVDMEVQQAGMDPYEVRVVHPVPQRLVGKVGPRTRVQVAVDRSDDQVVAIDWGSVHR